MRKVATSLILEAIRKLPYPDKYDRNVISIYIIDFENSISVIRTESKLPNKLKDSTIVYVFVFEKYYQQRQYVWQLIDIT